MIRLKDTNNAKDETRRNQNNGKKRLTRLKAGEIKTNARKALKSGRPPLG